MYLLAAVLRLLGAGVLGVAVLFGVPATTQVAFGVESGPWVLSGSMTHAAAYTDQGLATVAAPGAGTRIVTRGHASIPPALAAAGWEHVGDPDGYRGYLLDAYQGAATSHSKLFVITAPDGTQYRYVHVLAPGEQYNNSFVAVAPGGRWFVSGEWGTMRRLLVFAMPALPPRGPTSQALPLATVVTLDRAVRDVQGCDFSSATTLECATNDKSDDLYGVGNQLLAVHLARPLDGQAISASVSLLGVVPGVTACQGNAEVEGVDVHARRMRVAVVSSCTDTTTFYDYRLEPPGT